MTVNSQAALRQLLGKILRLALSKPAKAILGLAVLVAAFVWALPNFRLLWRGLAILPLARSTICAPLGPRWSIQPHLSVDNPVRGAPGSENADGGGRGLEHLGGDQHGARRERTRYRHDLVDVPLEGSRDPRHCSFSGGDRRLAHLRQVRDTTPGPHLALNGTPADARPDPGHHYRLSAVRGCHRPRVHSARRTKGGSGPGRLCRSSASAWRWLGREARRPAIRHRRAAGNAVAELDDLDSPRPHLVLGASCAVSSGLSALAEIS